MVFHWRLSDSKSLQAFIIIIIIIIIIIYYFEIFDTSFI